MAATELARGRNITVRPVPIEITYFLLAKEFGWLPSQIKNESSKDLKGISHVLSLYNRIKNKEAELAAKKASKRR